MLELNELSWALYIIDVINGLTTVLILMLSVAVVAFIGTGIGLFVGLVDQYVNYEEEIKKFLKTTFFNSMWVMMVMLLIITILPNKTTMYRILGLEVGEQVLMSEPAQKVGEDVFELGTKTIEILLKEANEKLEESE